MLADPAAHRACLFESADQRAEIHLARRPRPHFRRAPGQIRPLHRRRHRHRHPVQHISAGFSNGFTVSRAKTSPAARGWGWRSPRRSSMPTAAPSQSKANPAKGSRFTFTLQRVPDQSLPSNLAESEVKLMKPASILITDDESGIRLMLRTALESDGYCRHRSRQRPRGPRRHQDQYPRPDGARPEHAGAGWHGGAGADEIPRRRQPSRA